MSNSVSRLIVSVFRVGAFVDKPNSWLQFRTGGHIDDAGAVRLVGDDAIFQLQVQAHGARAARL